MLKTDLFSYKPDLTPVIFFNDSFDLSFSF